MLCYICLDFKEKLGLKLSVKRFTWYIIRIYHDRKIRPDGHRLASRGLSSDDKRWLRGTDLSIPYSHEYRILYLKKMLPEVPEYAEMRQDMMMSL